MWGEAQVKKVSVFLTPPLTGRNRDKVFLCTHLKPKTLNPKTLKPKPTEEFVLRIIQGQMPYSPIEVLQGFASRSPYVCVVSERRAK